MEVTLQLPDQIAQHFADGKNLSRRTLEAVALEGFRSRRLTSFEVAELLGLSRIEAQDFLGVNNLSLGDYDEAELDREAALWDKVDASH